MQKIKVTDMESAWTVARLIFPTECTRDEQRSNRYDCAVYGSTEEGYDGFEIRERKKQLWVYLGGDGETVLIDVAGASPSKTKELAKANKRIAELEEDKNRLMQSEWTLAKECGEAEKQVGDAQRRAEEAEAEVQRLKAKLYDILIEEKG